MLQSIPPTLLRMTTATMNMLKVFKGPGLCRNVWNWICALLKMLEECAPRMYHKRSIVLQSKLGVFSCHKKKRYTVFLLCCSIPMILWSIAAVSVQCFFILKCYFHLYNYIIDGLSTATLFSGPAITTPLFYGMITTIIEMLSSLKAVSCFPSQMFKLLPL